MNDWLDRTEYPFASQYFNVDGQRLHYIDEGEGEMLLFVHGTPSWSFDFRNVVKNLRSVYQCIAVDHIGFGLSDKPEHYDYSTQNHSRTLERFILEKDLRNITLVVHDFGGPIGLNVAIRHPSRFNRLVIMNSWLWSSNDDPDFVKMSRVLRSPLFPYLYRYLNFSPRFVLPSSFGEHKLSRRLLRQYTKPFANAAQRNGALAFARSLLSDQEWFQDLWEMSPIISSLPTLFVWGMKDPVIKPHNLDRFETRFRNSTTTRMEACGHFPQEEQPDVVAKAIHDFLNVT